MPDYRTLYFKLFNRITDAIIVLQQAQADVQRLYQESEEAERRAQAEQADTDKDG